MKRKTYDSISRIFYIIIIAYFSIVTFLTIGTFGGYFSPEKIPTDWWSALGVVVTLTLAILIMNYIRENDFLATQNKIDDFNFELENAKKLSTLSTILLDIASEENTSKEKWSKSYSNIENLYQLGFISDSDLHRISVEAWKQDDIISAFNLRKLSYDRNPENLDNKLNFLSVFTYIFSAEIDSNSIDNKYKRLFNDSELFLKEIGFEKLKNNQFKMDEFFNKYPDISNSNEIYSYSLTGRYFFKKRKYEESLNFFKLAIEKAETFKNWHNRYVIEIEFFNKNFKEAEKLLNEVKTKKEWKNDYRYIAFQELFINLLNIINNRPIEKPNIYLIIKGIGESHFNRFSMWNFTSIINQLQVNDDIKKKLKEVYRTYYLFFGSDDDDFKNEYKIEDIEAEKEKYFKKIIELK